MVDVKQGLSMPKYSSQYFWYKGFNGPVDGPPPVDMEMEHGYKIAIIIRVLSEMERLPVSLNPAL
jgi:hypothetical protein